MTRNSPVSWSDRSRFAQRIRRRYAAELALLPVGVPNKELLEPLFLALRAQGADVGSALRMTRQLVLERLLLLRLRAIPGAQSRHRVHDRFG